MVIFDFKCYRFGKISKFNLLTTFFWWKDLILEGKPLEREAGGGELVDIPPAAKAMLMIEEQAMKSEDDFTFCFSGVVV